MEVHEGKTLFLLLLGEERVKELFACVSACAKAEKY